MSRLTERINNVPDGESGVWVKNHDYITAAEKLADYEELEEQCLLLRLPCKVGDILYTNQKQNAWWLSDEDAPYCVKVEMIVFKNEGWFTVIYENHGRVAQFRFTDIGKTVFLTQSEAQEKLRKLRELRE